MEVQSQSPQGIETELTAQPGSSDQNVAIEQPVILTFEEINDFDPFVTESAPPQAIGTQPGRRRSQEEEDLQKLIPLAPRSSYYSKKFFGTGWKNAQFAVSSSSGPVRLPQDWNYKDTGVTVRAKVMGEPVYRRLILEITYRKSDDPSKTAVAYLQFDNHLHVTDYEVQDKVHRNRKGRNTKQHKKNQPVDTSENESNEQKEDSYWVVKFVAKGCTAFGMDIDDTGFDNASANVFRYLRRLTSKLKTGEKTQVMIRINAHFGIDETDGTDEKKKKAAARKERFRMAQDLIFDFKKSACRAWSPYCGPTGKPQTHWGNLVSREQINRAAIQPASAETETNGKDQNGYEDAKHEVQESRIIRYPSQISFASLEEAAIVFSYGAFLEWRREKELHDSISSMDHKVGFLNVAGHGIMAIMFYSMPDTKIAESFRVKEASNIVISFTPPERRTNRNVTCQGIAVPNIFSLPYRNPLYLVKTEFLEFFQSLATNPGQPLKLLNARVMFRIPHVGAARQVDAINLITNMKPGAEFAQRWQKILLNQSRGPRAVVDPLKDIDPTHERFQKILEDVLSKLTLSEDQIRCLKSCTAFPDGVLIIQGFPGAGKTFLLALIGLVFQMMGFHIVYGAPTHQAADANCEALLKLMGILNIQCRLLRAYRTQTEVQEFLSKAKKADRESESEGKSDTEHGEIAEPEETGEAAMSIEAQLLMLQIAQDIATADRNRCYGLPQLSLEFQVLRAIESAEKEGRTLLGHYPSEEQKALSQGLVALEDVYELEGPEVDMFAELRSHLQHMRDEPLSEWGLEDKNCALIAFKHVRQYVARASQILVSTNNNLASNVCSQHFGLEAKAVLLIRDEDPKELEIAAIVLGGDTWQLQHTVLTAKEQPGWNEFSYQMETSLVVRLIRANHPVLNLTEQRRFRPSFAEFLNRRIYKNEMRSHPVTDSLKVNPKWDRMVRAIFPITRADFDTGHFVLSLEISSCVLESSSLSRYSAAHVEAVLTLILANHMYGCYKGEDMKIITPYSAQRNLYRRALFQMRSQILEESQPSVETIDSMQGREAKVVILDFTVSDATKAGDLGFVDDDHRCNVAHSRMIEVLVTVMPKRIASSPLGTNIAQRLNSFGKIVRPKVPYVVEYMQWASQRGMVVEVDEVRESDVGHNTTFATVDGLETQQDANSAWTRRKYCAGYKE
ncbi:uncharacterized protein CDV56_100183 [Aspergillus thermomutatus]|uniref:DNA2/NAM7 helicase-like C-terminal domain-containing protein n=1 Tax=Aspergillus thermomutatus TaxID=41047 RepID=A0A397G233_ASPTH|nr:uncharacterized protein CDV56_100183 [Aspergillus thermomutatus]RHZ43366.1 hypothetical protein CDV56_100183 [Aspergillus thermomutatus]